MRWRCWRNALQPRRVFAEFAFPATGAPTARTMPDRLSEINNVKDFGAAGDGSTDDTAAIQAALDAAYGSSSSPNGSSGAIKNRPVFFPAGNYKITRALTLKSVMGAHIFGAGRFTTTIQNVTSGGSVFVTNGCEYSRFERLNLIASGTNSVCFDLDFDGNGLPLQSNTFSDIYFQTADIGLRIGNSGFMGSENLITNCFFANHRLYGLITKKFQCAPADRNWGQLSKLWNWHKRRAWLGPGHTRSWLPAKRKIRHTGEQWGQRCDVDQGMSY